MQAVLLAGALSDRTGWAEQLHHVPTIPIANVPMIVHSISLLRSLGVDEVTVNMFHGANNVLRLLQNIPQDHINIKPSLEQHLLGSANILQRIARRPVDPFIVLMGDVILERIQIENILNTHQSSEAAATLLVSQRQPGQRGYGQVTLNANRELVSISKENSHVSQGLINTGFYIFNSNVIDLIPWNKPYQIGRDLLPELIRHNYKVQVIEIEEYYRRITDYQQYWQVNMDLAAQRVKLAYPILQEKTPVEKPTGIRMQTEGPVIFGKGCKIDQDVVIKGPAVIGNYVHLSRGVKLDQVVILDHTRLGLATNFENSVLNGERIANVRSMEVQQISDPTTLRSNQTSPFGNIVAQLIHSLLALIILLLFSPIFLLLILAIAIESKGPVFYTQLRVGQRKQNTKNFFHPGQVFVFIKFRTMYTDSEERLKNMLANNEYSKDTFLKFKNDPRVTKVGKFVRKTSLDELPQLINVIKGDMRLVGNRPLPLYEAAKLTETWQQLRFEAPAGMTGLWQISGRSNLSLEERTILDNYYAVSRNFWSDMVILLKTIPAVILQRGAF